MKWVDWGLDANSGKKWWPIVAPEHEQSKLQEAARAVYIAVGGCGYCRMDMRMSLDGHVFVIDVNANCSVDCDEGSSMGLILESAGMELEEFLEEMLRYGIVTRAPNAGTMVR
jgi:D-alanine-D-alanine ligase-like ATP-grasp enzyme